MNFEDIYPALCEPFPPELVELLPGATNGDRALAMPYADPRAYQNRLDQVVGPSNWQVSYRPWGESAVICTLTIAGITREDVGEEKPSDPNCRTSAVAQAFKRACSSFGLGRYLYDLPMKWAPYDSKKKAIVDGARVVREMYREAGLISSPATRPQPAAARSAPAQAPAAQPERGTDGLVGSIEAKAQLLGYSQDQLERWVNKHWLCSLARLTAGQLHEANEQLRQALDKKAAEANLPIDIAQLQAETDVEIKRVGWNPDEGKQFLQKTFGKSSRKQLAVNEYQQLLLHLKTLPLKRA